MLTMVSRITWSDLSDAALSRHFAGVAEMAKGQRDRSSGGGVYRTRLHDGWRAL